jgi:hypothetical protein
MGFDGPAKSGYHQLKTVVNGGKHPMIFHDLS